MSILLEIREHIQKLYNKYAPGFNVLFRFLAAFITFFATNKVIGFNPYLNHAYTAGILAAVSVVFPAQILLFFEVVFIVLHILYVSRYLAFITALIFAILYFIYVRFIPKDGYVILSMPVLSSFGVPYVVPILLGIIETPLSIIPEAIGVVIYFFLQNVITVVSTSTEDTINLYYLVMQQTFTDKELYITLIVFSVVTIVVYFIRNAKIDYSFEIAIISGGFVNMILLLIMNFFMDIDMSMIKFFGSVIISVIIVWIIQFFRLSLNYSGVENLQFEDDEYYYYVRAVPKNSIAKADKNIKRYNAHTFIKHLNEDRKRGDEISNDKNAEAALLNNQNQKDDFDHNFDFTVSLDDDDLNDIEKKEK